MKRCWFRAGYRLQSSRPSKKRCPPREDGWDIAPRNLDCICMPRNAESQTNDSRVLVGKDAIEVDSHVRKSLGANAVIGKDIGAQLLVRRDCRNRIRNRVRK